MTKVGSDPASPVRDGRLPAEVVLRVLSNALEQSPNAVVITDPSGNIQYVNPRFAEMAGYDRTELTGADISGFGQQPATDRARLSAYLTAGRAWEGEFRAKRKDGQDYWVSAHVSPIRDANGVVTHFLGIVITHFLGINEDITHRKLAEETREQAGEQALPVSSAEPVFVPAMYIILVVALDGTILYTSETVPAVTRKAVGSSIYEYISPEHHERVRTHLEEVARSGKPASYAMPGAGSHGTTSIYATRVGPIHRGGKVVALWFVASDITERRRLETALHESEARFRSLSEAGIEAIAIHDKGKILDANQAFAAMFGYQLSEVIGMHALEFTAPEDRDRLMGNILSGYEEPYEGLGLRKDGSTFPVEICGKNMLYRGSMVRVAAIRDITERERLQATDGASPATLAREFGLSQREFEVLRLLAHGLTNRELAGRLRLSSRTIDHHVSHILHKLHVSNRTAAVVAAEQVGLLPAKSPR